MERYKYEDSQLAHFLLSAGYYLGKMNFSLPSYALNMYKSGNNNDRTLRDVLSEVNGKFLLLEFKRDKIGIENEKKKPFRINLIDYLKTADGMDYFPASVYGHLICYPSKQPTKIDFELQSFGIILDGPSNDKYRLTGVDEFMDSLVLSSRKKISVGCSFDEIDSYLKLLHSYSSKANYFISGVLLHFDESLGLRVFPFEDLHFLEKNISWEHESVKKKRALASNQLIV